MKSLKKNLIDSILKQKKIVSDYLFALVFLKQMIEFNHLFQKDPGKTASVAKGMVELNCLF